MTQAELYKVSLAVCATVIVILLGSIAFLIFQSNGTDEKIAGLLEEIDRTSQATALDNKEFNDWLMNSFKTE